jgi:aspartate carbamoyltransferase catalytic subunit
VTQVRPPQAPGHLTGIAGLERGEIERLLTAAERHAAWLEGPAPKSDLLRGRVVVLGFLEPSTRTRVSFEIAGKRLGADTISLGASGSSLEKGESLLDTAWTLESMGVDCLVLRHPRSGAPADLAARLTRTSLVNGGDGAHEHPTQALLDALALRARGVDLAGLSVAIVGDVAYSRVARSDLMLFTALGARVTVCGPPSLLVAGLEEMARAPGRVRVTHRLEEALEGAGAVIALRLQRERQEAGLVPSIEDYVRGYQITAAGLARSAPGALLLHPGPVNRGIEVESSLADAPNSLVREQVTAGVAVRAAVLERACAAGEWARQTSPRAAVDREALRGFVAAREAS